MLRNAVACILIFLFLGMLMWYGTGSRSSNGTTSDSTKIGEIGVNYQIGYEVYVLRDKEYYYSLIEDLRSANKSIMVAMYSMIYDPDDPYDWANDLNQRTRLRKRAGGQCHRDHRVQNLLGNIGR